MYKHIDIISDHGGGGAAALAAPGNVLDDGLSSGMGEFFDDWREKLHDIDWVPDLGRDIGSLPWFRGVATLGLLCGVAISAIPDFGPIQSHVPSIMVGERADQIRSQSIAPLAYGSDTGIRMAATDAVRPLANSPERPSIELVATIGSGDSLRRVLQRSGVASNEAVRVADMVSSAVSLGDIAPGTKIDVLLGRRTARSSASTRSAFVSRTL